MTPTVDDIVEMASALQHTHCGDLPGMLADAVLSLLAEDAPCGFELPRITGGGKYVCIPESWATGHEPSDARALARMLLRAADEADKEKL